LPLLELADEIVRAKGVADARSFYDKPSIFLIRQISPLIGKAAVRSRGDAHR